MSATPGKVLVDGITEVRGEKVFVLKMLQGRDPNWVNQIFFAKFDPAATWLDQLEPAFGATSFFFDKTIEEMKEAHVQPAWGVETHIKKRVSDFGYVEWE
jgi:hypothetical protein